MNIDIAIIVYREANDSNEGFEISKSQSEMVLITSEHEGEGHHAKQSSRRLAS